MQKTVTFKLEELGSRGKLRILQTIYEQGPMNLSLLSRKTGLNYTSVNIHVESLKKMGLLTEKHYANIRMIRPGPQELTIKLKRGMRTRYEVVE